MMRWGWMELPPCSSLSLAKISLARRFTFNPPGSCPPKVRPRFMQAFMADQMRSSPLSRFGARHCHGFIGAFHRGDAEARGLAHLQHFLGGRKWIGHGEFRLGGGAVLGF